MKNPSERSTPVEETIRKLARRARTVSRVWKGIAVGMLSFMLALVGGLMILVHTGDHRRTSDTDMVWLGLPIFSGLLICFWVLSEQQRLGASCRSLSDRFAPQHSKADQSVPAAAIGPLLELTLTGNCSNVPTALLGDLLKSVQTGEEVILTANQMRLLHVLVIEGRWDGFHMRTGPSIEEAAKCDLRPSAISALAYLGDRSSIPVLERFIEKTCDLELHAAALQSIEQIRKRSEFRPDEMLRASIVPEHADTLLRAASGDGPQIYDSHQLLRADQTAIQRTGQIAIESSEDQGTRSESHRVRN